MNEVVQNGREMNLNASAGMLCLFAAEIESIFSESSRRRVSAWQRRVERCTRSVQSELSASEQKRILHRTIC
jgi:hypothetical protein